MREKALMLSRRALDMLLVELSGHSQGKMVGVPLAQLLLCRKQLDAMILELESGLLKPSSLRLRGMGAMISDSWPLDYALGDALLLAEQAYLKAT